MKECWRVFNETGILFSEKEERFWSAAFVIEIIVVFLLNAFTLAIYTRNRHLRKRSAFLIINLTVADLLVGIVVGLPPILEPDNLNRDLELTQAFSWQSFVYLTLHELFVVASLANISLILLERLHAALFPFRHCLVGLRVYLTIILCSWSFALTLSSVIVLFYLRASPAFLYVLGSYTVLIVLKVSACFRAKARLMRVTSWQEDKQTELPEDEENLKGLTFRGAPKLLAQEITATSAKGRSALRHRENQRAKPEIVRKNGLVSEFNKNAKMVSKSSKHGKTLKPF